MSSCDYCHNPGPVYRVGPHHYCQPCAQYADQLAELRDEDQRPWYIDIHADESYL